MITKQRIWPGRQKFGEAALARQAAAQATDHYRQSPKLRRELGDKAGIWVAVEGLACSAALQGKAARAGQL
jgi:hypothetical protein